MTSPRDPRFVMALRRYAPAPQPAAAAGGLPAVSMAELMGQIDAIPAPERARYGARKMQRAQDDRNIDANEEQRMRELVAQSRAYAGPFVAPSHSTRLLPQTSQGGPVGVLEQDYRQELGRQLSHEAVLRELSARRRQFLDMKQAQANVANEARLDAEAAAEAERLRANAKYAPVRPLTEDQMTRRDARNEEAKRQIWRTDRAKYHRLFGEGGPQ